jgi:pimeloyl-ACP methyl ester carboxylesterase
MEKGPSAQRRRAFFMMMSIRPGSLKVEVVRAESARFRHPLLLLHGLWTGGWIWRDFAGYLAHRGWDSWLPSFAGECSEGERVRQLAELRSILPAPPIIVAHDASLVIAVDAAATLDAPALVGVSPLVGVTCGASLGVLTRPQFWVARLFGGTLRPPRGSAGRALLAGIGRESEPLRADSGAFLESVLRKEIPAATARPGLLVLATDDPILPPQAAERLARTLGWSLDLQGTAGHFPMRAPGWDLVADRVHRWLVRAIGEDLLLLAADDSE